MERENYMFLRRQQEAVQIRRITTDWNEQDFSAFLLNVGEYDRRDGASVAYGAYLEDVPVGAVELEAEEGYVALISIIVDPQRRRSGIGTALLEKAKSFAAEMDVDQIVVDFVNDTQDEEGMQAFFRANGFYVSDTADPVLTLCPSDALETGLFRKMKAKGLPRNVLRVDQLPADMLKKVGHTGERQGKAAVGRRQEDLSLACVDKNELGAFVVFVKRGGNLCLSAAYSDEAHITPFLCMLAHSLATAAQRGVRELHVTMGKSSFTEILEKILEDQPGVLRRREFQRMFWYLEDARMELEATDRVRADRAARAAEDGMEILVPRLMRLMEILENEGIDCDLMLGEVPYILVDGRIAVQYLPRDDNYERFSLLFSAHPAGNLEPEELRGRCESVNMLSPYAAAVPNGRDMLLRFAALEYITPIEREAFLDYLDVFQEEVFRAGMFSGEGSDQE